MLPIQVEDIGKMKILCLHGMGTNADIFRAQTASFRSLLPSYYTFYFPEGEYECAAADGIAEVYPGPYLCWYPFPPTLDHLSEAHELIWNIIEEDGPFDGVMGFSQGAALAASILLHHEKNTPLETPPFRFAIFICASLPFSVDQTSGFELTQVFTYSGDPMPGDLNRWQDLVNREQLTDQKPNNEPFQLDAQELQSFVEPISRASSSNNIAATNSSSSYSDSDSVSTEDTTLSDNCSLGDGEEVPLSVNTNGTRIFRFHPEVDTVRISIPTAHVYGKNDPYLSQSVQLVNMSQLDLVRAMDHGGAHDIPRSNSVTKAIADTIEKTIMKSEFMI
ncbi:hypothetical protein UA08_07742 [Talaromyces atroroseus]|uniref:Serine hydrolase domain-containing protein n=1 Tax=Talaromyces atroroseus TaxID=1441469 RepID=A0A225AR39_TALAT|nr:hypothetical protein UA08_07742 [Talaromyces atroroseus]OKL56915.1 hypothetical protein UA08_07742 [Talaromyces atroroseus]